MRGLSTLLISRLKGSTLMMVGVKTLVQMVSSMSSLEFAAQWMVTTASLWSCSEESHCPFLPGPFGCHANNHFRSSGAYFFPSNVRSFLWLPWMTSHYWAGTNSLSTGVSIMRHTGFLRTKSRLWEIKVPFGTYQSSLHLKLWLFYCSNTLLDEVGTQSPSLYVPICFPHYLGAF